MSTFIDLLSAYSVRQNRVRGKFVPNPTPDELRQLLSHRGQGEGGRGERAADSWSSGSPSSADDLIVVPLAQE